MLQPWGREMAAVARRACAGVCVARFATGTSHASRPDMRSFLVAILLAACTTGPRTSDPPTTASPRGGDKPLIQAVLEVQGRMHERFAATNRMLYAIAISDLMRAQREAQLVADLDEPDVLPIWKPYVDDIRASARAVIATADTTAAARTMAGLGRACARCHQQANAKLVFADDPAPPSEKPLRATMASHQWAANRMWQGLLAPSTERWNDGARALAEAPLAITAEVGEPPHSLGIADDVSRIRLLARRAQTTTELDARTELYGELLGTCVQCHRTIRDR
jgi:hypothetical protein